MSNVTLQIQNWQERPDFSALEQAVLEYWDLEHAFERSVTERSEQQSYVFYDGPPFATGLPHYGHLLASTSKDVIPRYWTMKGYRVERKWGWDCHGLPIENLIEQELGLKGGKKGIEDYGIANFNQACRSAILRFDSEWEGVIKRLGRWVDFSNSYKTMDATFMESVWWAFRQLYSKDLVYQGRKVVLYCPRCATPLSNFEIAMDNSYKTVEDRSLYVLFRLSESASEYVVAWTTTPWTLFGNVALAVKPDASYARVRLEDGRTLWMAEDLREAVLAVAGLSGTLDQTVLGKELVGKTYEPLYTYMSTDGKAAYRIVPADFVSLQDGTGIVHTAAIYGEDDYKLAQHEQLPCVPTLDDQGRFTEEIEPVRGQFYKKGESWVVNNLQERGLVWHAGTITHAYPFCYRCATPLYYSAVPAWFINIQKLKPELIAHNEKISWYPDHLKHGRFGKGLETAPDWNISRSRYWGTPMPVWIGEKTGAVRVVGSRAELAQWAVEPINESQLTDIHREHLDTLELWVDDAKTEKGKRIPEVFDCWVESGSMPFASHHYPFEQKEMFEARLPAQFISEYIAQTRAWFYTLHVLSVGLFDKPAFEHALTTGTILASDGTKMSKSKKNFPDPMVVVEKYGADALRLYLMSSTVMKAENLNFDEKGVEEIKRKTLGIWWNVLAFYRLYAGEQQAPEQLPTTASNVLDRWVLQQTVRLTDRVMQWMDAYNVVSASRELMRFTDELSTWYVRLSRDRFRAGDEESIRVLGAVLRRLSQLFAPFAPFFAELCWQNLPGCSGSVHWSLLPSEQRLQEELRELCGSAEETDLERSMVVAQKAVEALSAFRKEQKIPVKQPLSSARLGMKHADRMQAESAVRALIEVETNIEQVLFEAGTGIGEEDVRVLAVDTDITPELEAKRQLRESVRTIQQLRRVSQVAFGAQVDAVLPSWPETLEQELKQKAGVRTLVKGDVASVTPVSENAS